MKKKKIYNVSILILIILFLFSSFSLAEEKSTNEVFEDFLAREENSDENKFLKELVEEYLTLNENTEKNEFVNDFIEEFSIFGEETDEGVLIGDRLFVTEETDEKELVSDELSIVTIANSFEILYSEPWKQPNKEKTEVDEVLVLNGDPEAEHKTVDDISPLVNLKITEFEERRSFEDIREEFIESQDYYYDHVLPTEIEGDSLKSVLQVEQGELTLVNLNIIYNVTQIQFESNKVRYNIAALVYHPQVIKRVLSVIGGANTRTDVASILNLLRDIYVEYEEFTEEEKSLLRKFHEQQRRERIKELKNKNFEVKIGR